MKKCLLFLTFFVLLCPELMAQSPKREMRGAWIATVSNIDWPTRSHTPAQQQAALISILNHHQETGMNTIFLQVRSNCDAMYPSSIEPWSVDLNGLQGRAPSPLWDPLQFAIDECRKRGMELHAWINPYRAMSSYSQAAYNALDPLHVAKQHPDWLLATPTQRILDPAIPEVREHVTKVIMDIVRRYDVDGIHFDDYFYPNATFNDDSTFNIYANGFTDRGDWRRNNVNLLIKKVNDSINTVKPWVKFGVSPSGIWRNGTQFGGSATSGLEHYVTLYADSRKWIQEHWVDYLCPQVYWQIGLAAANYSVLIPWWNNVSNDRNIYIGMAGYKVGAAGQGTFTTDNTMIPREIRMNRDPAYPNIQGQVIYQTNSLQGNLLGFRDSLKLFYQKPALQPAMPWKDNTAPAPVTSLSAQINGLSARLQWIPPAATVNEFDKIRQFAVYRSATAPIDISNANNILALVHADSTGYTDNTVQSNTTYYYTVTSLDRFHNESAAANTVSVHDTVPPLQLMEFLVSRYDEQQVQLSWRTTGEENVSHFEVERSIDSISFTKIGQLNAVNAAGIQLYQLMDPVTIYDQPIYYRLKIVDGDNQAFYSPVRSIIISQGNRLVKLYPTVLKKGELIKVQLLQPVAHPLPWVIYDAAGREVAAGMLSATSTNATINLPVTGRLGHGWYIFQVIRGKEAQTARFMIQ